MGSSSLNNSPLFDPIRGCFVKATPEERIRQAWIQKMIEKLGYPKELLVVEKALRQLPHLDGASLPPDRRLDILCYASGIHPSHPLFPLLLIECKDKALTEDALNQVIGYNHYVGAYFVAALSAEMARVGYFDAKSRAYIFCSHLPSFKELIQWLKR